LEKYFIIYFLRSMQEMYRT